MTYADLERKELLVRALIQFEDIYDRLTSQISPDLFWQTSDLHLKIILQRLRDYRSAYNKCPTYDELRTYVIQSLPPGFDSSILRSINLFFDCNPLRERPNFDFLEDIANSIKLEHEKQTLAQGLASVNGDPHALTRLLENSLSRIKTRSGNILDASVKLPDDPFDFCKDEEKFRYGIAFLDNFLGGGSTKPETNLLIAPTGVGKTMFGLNLCTNWALQAHLEEQSFNVKDRGLAVFFTYELGAKPLTRRIICQSANIDAERLEAYVTGKISKEDFRPDIERYSKMKPIMEKHFCLANFSGESTGERSYGFGGIPEVVAFLRELQDRTQRPVGLVVVDWIEAAVKRNLSGNAFDSSSSYSLGISNFTVHAIDKIAKGFNCVLWLIHQVAGASAKKGSGYLFHHTDASWSKNIAQYVDFAFSLSNPDPNGGMIFTCTKYRRTHRRNPVYLTMTKSLRFKQENKTLVVEDNSRVTVAEELQDVASESKPL